VSSLNPVPTLVSQRIGPSSLFVDYTPVTGGRGIVVFGHAGGSGRGSPRNRLMAGVLQDYGLSTLMVDLLPEAAQPADPRLFDIALLSARLIETMDWLRVNEPKQGAQVALLGIGTCGAAALRISALSRQRITAVVTRGGRPDLAAEYLHDVRVPTLMIVGGNDPDIVELNRRATQAMRCEHRLDVLPGSTQRFEEPGALEAVAHLAGAWFAKHGAVPGRAHTVARSA
jgi:putative phosphoribosyl transferase